MELFGLMISVTIDQAFLLFKVDKLGPNSTPFTSLMMWHVVQLASKTFFPFSAFPAISAAGK
jgi:hypothetical protein